MDDGRRAFPQHTDAFDGMTLREYFAAAALTGLLAAEAGCDDRDTFEMTAKHAVRQADALLAALAKRPVDQAARGESLAPTDGASHGA